MKRFVAVVLSVGALGAFPGAALGATNGHGNPQNSNAFHACENPSGTSFEHASFCSQF